MRDSALRMEPAEGVRVLVTLEALWQLEASKSPDLPSALDIFERHRGTVELAASRKFDDLGVEEGELRMLSHRADRLRPVSIAALIPFTSCLPKLAWCR
jgi:Protein of unknown function (DUF1488)